MAFSIGVSTFTRIFSVSRHEEAHGELSKFPNVWGVTDRRETAWMPSTRLSLPANPDNILDGRADLGPGKLGIVLRRLTFLKHCIKLGSYAGKGSGRRFRQFFEQGPRSVGRLLLSAHSGGVPYFPVGGIPVSLMGREVRFSLRADRCVVVLSDMPKCPLPELVKLSDWGGLQLWVQPPGSRL
ncbi:hypothetical protein [Mesorhizobium silamurunense]|uniref:hypothetical protein n=1 Tax=Mesorhizobium silamurunense TaxID=499528 RepID=UPI001FE7E8F0|nr:hypothetical protein [Mesorhizobium silamurunense]